MASVFGEHLDAALASAVWQCLSLDPCDAAVDRADVHDASGDVVLLHVLDRFMGQIGRAAQVQRYLGIPVIQRHVAELALGHFQRAAGVVDEDVHRAEVLDEIPHHPHCLLPAADVRAVNLCVHAVFAAFRRGLLRTGSVVVVVYADVAAVLREGDRRRPLLCRGMHPK